MHQSHNIPWHILSEHVKFTHQNIPISSRTGTRSKPRFSDRLVSSDKIEARNKPTQRNALNHFVDKVVNGIEEFSRTERFKYPGDLSTGLSHPDVGPLVPNEQWQKMTSLPGLRFEIFDPEEMRNIENWISAFEPSINLPEIYASVVKALLAVDDVKTVLMLSSHPRLNRDEEIEVQDNNTNSGNNETRVLHVNALERIATIGQAYVYGWADLAEFSLELYILLNLIASIAPKYERQHGRLWYRKLERYRQVCYNINNAKFGRKDLPSTDPNVVRSLSRPQKFNSPYEVPLLSSTEFGMNRLQPLPASSEPPPQQGHIGSSVDIEGEIMRDNDLFEDVQALHGYLSKLFRIIYVSDMALRECGCTFDWHNQTVYVLSNLISGLQYELVPTGTNYKSMIK